MQLDAIESSNVLESLSKQNGLTLGILNTFINSYYIPDLIVLGEAVPNIIKSAAPSQDDVWDTDKEKEHGSESLRQDSNHESYDGGKLKRWKFIQHRQRLKNIQNKE